MTNLMPKVNKISILYLIKKHFGEWNSTAVWFFDEILTGKIEKYQRLNPVAIKIKGADNTFFGMGVLFWWEFGKKNR